MATLVLNRADVFPAGTVVGAYAGNSGGVDGIAPPGAAAETQTVAAGGAATFATLTAGVPYVFHALVTGEHRRVRARIADSFADRGAALGTGNTTNGSASIASAVATSGAFVAGQRISGPGIPAGTRIHTVSGGTLTLDNKATATATGIALQAEGGRDPKARIRQRRAAAGIT
jgi:hypothetical protein